MRRPATVTLTWALGLMASLIVDTTAARADLASRAVREAVELALRRLGAGASREAAQGLSRRVETLAARHGDDVLLAVRRGGFGAVRQVEEAGEHGGLAARLIARHGDEAAALVADPRRLALIAGLGDDAALALLRHGAAAEPTLRALGAPAARALASLSPRQARRLAILAESGTLARTVRAAAVLAVVGRFGDRAMDFVWRHKGALAVSAVLAAFLAEPEPYLDGARALGGEAMKSVAGPVAAVPARLLGWLGGALGPIVIVAAVVLNVVLAVRAFRKPQSVHMWREPDGTRSAGG